MQLQMQIANQFVMQFRGFFESFVQNIFKGSMLKSNSSKSFWAVYPRHVLDPRQTEDEQREESG